MNAEPLLSKVAKVLAEHRLEAVMVGNAAAALHGAPVTTLDIDFMFRKTPRNLKKLKAVASSLGADILPGQASRRPLVRRTTRPGNGDRIWSAHAADRHAGGYH
jgi:hypothetical protein